MLNLVWRSVRFGVCFMAVSVMVAMIFSPSTGHGQRKDESLPSGFPSGKSGDGVKCNDWTCANRPVAGGGFIGWSGYDTSTGAVVSDCRVGGGTIRTCLVAEPADGCLPPGEGVPPVKCTGSYIVNPADPPISCYVQWEKC